MSVSILDKTAFIETDSYTIGVPVSDIEEAYTAMTGKLLPNVAQCPSCGTVATYTGTCGYCGSACE